MDISANIKAIRKSKSIAQAEIARRLDLDPSSYHRLENRGAKLSLEQAERIAQALEVSLVELITWETEDRINPVASKYQLPKNQIAELEDRLRDKHVLVTRLEDTKFGLQLHVENVFNFVGLDLELGEDVPHEEAQDIRRRGETNMDEKELIGNRRYTLKEIRKMLKFLKKNAYEFYTLTFFLLDHGLLNSESLLMYELYMDYNSDIISAMKLFRTASKKGTQNNG